MSEDIQSKEAGTVRLVPTSEGIRFETIVKEPTPPGQAYVETAKAKSRRELELEAGQKRVADAAREQANRPPRIISDAEKRATGQNTAVFRPNMIHADRVIGHNGAPVSQQLGALMRRVGSAPAAAPQEAIQKAE